jgi:hypothetical protein
VTTVDERSTRRQRRFVYLIVGVVLGALLVAGLLAFRTARSTADAEAKADQLIVRLQQAGARTPTRDRIVRLLGDDGGAVCADPNTALSQALTNTGLANGAGGPGTRPVIAGSTVVLGEALVIETYCPDQLAAFRQYTSGLRFADRTGV